jgi:hypothetical protein
LTKAGSTQFSATAGTYVIHVIGLPDASKAGSGPIGIQVTNAGDNSQVASFSDTLGLPPASIPNNQGALSDTFTVPATGSYQVTVTDFQFPQSLSAWTLAITQTGVAQPITTLPGGPTTITLQAGVTYSILALSQTSTSVNAGLYGINISAAGGGAPAYSKSIPVGAVTLLSSPTLAAVGYTLQFADLKIPSALSQGGAAVALNGEPVAQVTGPTGGSQTFNGSANTYQVFALGVPQAPSPTASYSVTLSPQSGAPALDVARAVSVSGSSTSAYSFDTSVTASGTYALDLADFGLSAQFTSLTAFAVQKGQQLPQGTTLNTTGSLNVTLNPGPVSILVFAQPGTGGSLFGIDLTASGGSSPVFATTQGVGQLFGTQTITVPSAGSYTVTVADVGFPTNLANLAVAVTQGSNRLGAIFTGGSFTFAGAANTSYFVNFIAQPGTTTSDHAGTYSINVAPTPPAPVVNFSSNTSSVTSGGTVALTWSSQNATSCTGSSTPAGVWSTSSLSGNAQQTGAITTSTTFTLKCTGDGGTTTQTVTVGISAPSGGGHGGGGAIGLDLLAVLTSLTLVRLQMRSRRTQ